MDSCSPVSAAVCEPNRNDTLTGIVVVNFGSHKLVDTNVGALSLQAAHARVIIVDNFSSVAEADAIRRVAATRGWDLLMLPRNRGFGAGMNAGIREAIRLGCEYFLLLNPDAIVTPEVVRALRQDCQRDPLTLVSPAIIRTDGSVAFQGSEVQMSSGRIRSLIPGLCLSDDNDRPAATPVSQFSGHAELWLTGACLAIARKLFELVGGFDESYFLYWEDVDISYRALQAGAQLAVRRDLVATHSEGGTQHHRVSRGKSDLYYYYNCKNRILFASHHLGPWATVKWILYTPIVSWEILKRGGRRQLLMSPKPLAYTVMGSAHGIAAAVGALLGLSLHGRSESNAKQIRRYETNDPKDRRTSCSLRIVVAVLTYLRPDDLRTSLPVLIAQAENVAELGDQRCSVRVLVVDNDAAGSANAVIAELGSSRVDYVIEPEPGISAARNRAIDCSGSADALVFVDDDEVPHPHWLERLLQTWRATGAAGVAGRVISEFDGDLNPWIKAGGFFDRRTLHTGTNITVAATNNLLLDSTKLRNSGIRFDPRFGLTGGEDTVFTRAFTSQGYHLVWCDEAVVNDRVPVSRMTREWVLARAWRYGNSASLTELCLSQGVSRLRIRMRLLARASARVAAGSARYYLGCLTSSDRHEARGLRTLQRGLGMFSGTVGVACEEYSRSVDHSKGTFSNDVAKESRPAVERA